MKKESDYNLGAKEDDKSWLWGGRGGEYDENPALWVLERKTVQEDVKSSDVCVAVCASWFKTTDLHVSITADLHEGFPLTSSWPGMVHQLWGYLRARYRCASVHRFSDEKLMRRRFEYVEKDSVNFLIKWERRDCQRGWFHQAEIWGCNCVKKYWYTSRCAGDEPLLFDVIGSKMYYRLKKPVQIMSENCLQSLPIMK